MLMTVRHAGQDLSYAGSRYAKEKIYKKITIILIMALHTKYNEVLVNGRSFQK